MKDIYDILRQWRKRPGANFALATMVRAQGSSYRRPGARMLICEDGTSVGSLSAGCLESEVVECARKVLRTGQSVVVSFDTRRRFGCAGKIDIFIERMSQSFLCEVAACLNARRTCFAVTTLEGSFVGKADSFPREANGFPYSPFVQKISPPLRLLNIWRRSGQRAISLVRPFPGLGYNRNRRCKFIFDCAGRLDGRDREIAQLRTRFRHAPKTIASRAALRWIDRAPQETGPNHERTARGRHHCQRGFFCACWIESRCGDARGNRT